MIQVGPDAEGARRVVLVTAAAGLAPALAAAVVALVVLGWAAAVVVALVVALGWAAAVLRRARTSVQRLLDGLHAHEVPAGSSPRLENLLEGLGVTCGVAPPEVYTVQSDAMNALAVADDRRSAVVLTRGLLDGLGRLELEGVLANLLARVRDGSAGFTTTVVGLLGATAPAGRILHEALGEQRGVTCDLAAVDLTRYPPALISALRHMEGAGTGVDGAAPSTAPLWIAPAVGGPLSEVVGADASLDVRIAVLGEL